MQRQGLCRRPLSIAGALEISLEGTKQSRRSGQRALHKPVLLKRNEKDTSQRREMANSQGAGKLPETPSHTGTPTGDQSHAAVQPLHQTSKAGGRLTVVLEPWRLRVRQGLQIRLRDAFKPVRRHFLWGK